MLLKRTRNRFTLLFVAPRSKLAVWPVGGAVAAAGVELEAVPASGAFTHNPAAHVLCQQAAKLPFKPQPVSEWHQEDLILPNSSAMWDDSHTPFLKIVVIILCQMGLFYVFFASSSYCVCVGMNLSVIFLLFSPMS